MPRALRHDDGAQPRDILGSLPTWQGNCRIGAHDEEEPRALVALRQLLERVSRIGNARAFDLAEVKRKKRIICNRKRDHVGTLRCRRDLLILLEMRIARRNEKHTAELKLLGCAARDDEMPIVHRVEGAAHDTYASVFLHALASNLALTAHEILDRCKRSRAHGAACVKLLGADANLGA